MAALGIQVFSQASRSTIEGLPEEILDHIVQDVGPIYNTASLLPFCGRTSRRCWLSCSLVCRRWHRIAAPYVFRFVEINPDSPGEIEDFLSMLSENSTIGRLIQAITIDVAELSMDTIATLLVLLPRLRVLDINTVQSKRSKDLTALYGRFKLERLSYSSDWYGDFEWEVVQLLQLFEEVGEVELDDPLSDSAFMNPPNPIAMTGRPRVTSLKLATFDNPISPYLTYLHRHDAFRHLTCLSIYCASPLTLGCVNELLLYVGETLRELYLHLNFQNDWRRYTTDAYDVENAQPLRDTVLRSLRTGIKACGLLHGFRLHMDGTWWWRGHHASMPQALRGLIAVNDWLLALCVLSLAPESGSKLDDNIVRHVSFTYKSHQWRNNAFGFDVLPWAMMHEVFRSFVKPTKILLSFEYPFEDAKPTGPDGFVLSSEEYTLRQVAEYKNVSVGDRWSLFFFCEQESCRWHNSRHLRNVRLKFKDR